VIGAYGPNQSMIDVGIMLAAGVFGFIFRRFGFSPAPLIMGLVLGTMAEETLKQSLIIFDHDWLRFFSRPIVVSLFAVTLAGFLSPVVMKIWRSWRAAA